MNLKANAKSSEVQFAAAVNFAAGEKDSDLPRISILANTGKPMELKGHAYPVILNMKGVTFEKDTTPFIMDHDPKVRIGHTVQGGQKVDPAKGTITVEGIGSSVSTRAKEFFAEAKNGFPFQSSVGGDILKKTFIAEGKRVLVNGRQWDGPIYVSDQTRIKEISILTFGADNGTKVKVAASKDNSMQTFEEFVASLELDVDQLTEGQRTKLQAQYEKLKASDDSGDPKKGKKGKAKKGPDKVKAEPKEDDEDDVVDDLTAARKKRAIDTERIDTIEGLAAQYGRTLPKDEEKGGLANKIIATDEDGEELKFNSVGKFKAHAIESGMSAESFELSLMRASRTNMNDNNAPGQHNKTREMETEAFAAALCRQFGMVEHGQVMDPAFPTKPLGRPYGLKHFFSEKVLEASHGKQYQVGGSIQALLDLQIRASGGVYASVDRKSGDFIAEAVRSYDKIVASGFSTLNIPNILENTMHKMALAGFEGVEGVWREITGRKTLNDFRPHNMYRLDFNGHFRKVAVDGELKHISMVDTKQTIQAETFGAMIAVDRKTITNDDLALVVQKASSIGMLGAMRIEESALSLLLANTGSYFAAGNNNLITGAGTVLGHAGLETARQAFLDQVVNGKPAGMTPRILLVGSNQLTLARNLFQQETVAVVGDPGTALSREFANNQFAGAYRPLTSPYINNTSVTDQDGAAISGQSSTAWYLFADPNAPQGAALFIGFLNGRDTPFFDQADTQFNIPGGIQMRSYLDWGVAFGIIQAGLKSAGA